MSITAKTAPIKRNKHLVPLSREHHTGLLFGWKIKQGLNKNVSKELLLNYVRFFWTIHLREHMNQEERVLNSLLELQDPMRMAIEEDHRQVEEKIENLLSGGYTISSDLRALADLLITHIRFEEREFFPYLEQLLSGEQLKQIGKQLHPLKPEKEEEFMPQFWQKDYPSKAA